MVRIIFRVILGVLALLSFLSYVAIQTMVKDYDLDNIERAAELPLIGTEIKKNVPLYEQLPNFAESLPRVGSTFLFISLALVITILLTLRGKKKDKKGDFDDSDNT